MDKIKIGFLSSFSPDDKRASSGTNYTMSQCLKHIGEVEWIPIKSRPFSKYLRGGLRLISRLFGKNLDIANTKLGAKICYKHIDIDTFPNYDVICAFFCMRNIYDLDVSTPIVYFSDATFAAMLDYYPSYSNLPKFNIQEGIEMESRATRKASLCIYGSEWAAKSAREDLDTPPDKIKVIEYGPNINSKDISNIEKKFELPLKILFLGVNWERKGGNIAADATIWLNKNGIKAELNIIGVKEIPNKYKKYDFIKCHGFLNKNNEHDYQKLISIINFSHCLLLPTYAECIGIAFAEACAYGLPVFTHDTGGIGNYVINQKNGYRLPIGSTGEDFGKIIKKSIEQKELFKLSQEAKELYYSKLNWNKWTEEVQTLLYTVIRENTYK